MGTCPGLVYASTVVIGVGEYFARELGSWYGPFTAMYGWPAGLDGSNGYESNGYENSSRRMNIVLLEVGSGQPCVGVEFH